MSSESPREDEVNNFIAQLEEVPWFSNLGRPVSSEEEVVRIATWDDWPGPEEPAILELSSRQQELFDEIMEGAGEQAPQLKMAWDEVHAVVFRTASVRVPYDPAEDAWHGPTAAVWQAAWTAGLIALCLQTSRPIPAELEEQWSWYVRGHWPSGYASWTDDGLGPLLVY